MRIKRTFDMGLVKRIITHPAIFPYVTDDGTPSADKYTPVDDNSIYYLLVIDEGSVHGLYIAHPANYITYEMHTCLLPSCRGKKADKAGQLVLRWVFENTRCLKIMGRTPENNKPALAYSKRAGFNVEGLLRDSFLKDGKLYNQVIFGMTRKELWP